MVEVTADDKATLESLIRATSTAKPATRRRTYRLLGLALILLGESGMRAQRRISQPRLERPGWLDPERKGTPEQENRAGL